MFVKVGKWQIQGHGQPLPLYEPPNPLLKVQGKTLHLYAAQVISCSRTSNNNYEMFIALQGRNISFTNAIDFLYLFDDFMDVSMKQCAILYICTLTNFIFQNTR